MAIRLLSASAILAVAQIRHIDAFSASALHPSSSQGALFVSTAAAKSSSLNQEQQWNQQRRSASRRTTTQRLASNGGMDAYDAQMAAVRATGNGNEAQSLGTGTTITSTDEPTTTSSSYDSSMSDSSSRPKWSGQNSYTQHLLQPTAVAASNNDIPGVDYSSSSAYYSDASASASSTGADAYAAQMDASSRKSFVEEQQQKYQYNNNDQLSDVDVDDPYEMEFTHYLQALQNEIEDNNEEINVVTIQRAAAVIDEVREEEEEENIKSSWQLDTPTPYGIQNPNGMNPFIKEAAAQQQEYYQSIETSTNSELSEEELEDKFLSMVSNEVQYKQLLMESTSKDTTNNEASSANYDAQAHFKADATAPSKSTEQTPPTPEELEDQFLKMVSNEVEYKKLINQSPYSITDLEVEVLLQRFLDNLEDGTQKNNGKFKGESKLSRKSVPKEERKTVVVAGTGWAAHAFVKLASTYDLRIVVVSPVNHFVFTPMLASAAVGTVEYRSMTEPIRVTNPYIDNFVEGRAIGVDVNAKKLQVQLTSLSTFTGAFKGLATTAPCRLEPEPVLTQIVYSEDGTVQRDKYQGAGDVIELSYDHLICAVGTASRSSMVPGAKEYCFNLKTSQDSKRLRTAIGEALEMASRPDVQEFYYPDEETKMQAREERRRRVRIAVVGGGPTGVELSGELCDFFGQVCAYPDGAYQFLRDDVEVMLVHGGSELLPAMDKELRGRALEALEEQGVDVRLNTRLKEVGLDYIKIFEKGSDVVETIPLGITVWAAGNAPVPFVKELLSQLPESAAGSGGRIRVDRWLRCPTPSQESFGSILVLGDVGCFESQSKYDTSPEPLPQTAQVAGQQGAFVARMLNRGYDMQQSPPKLPELSSDEAFSLLRVWLLSRDLEEAPGFNFLSLGLLAYVGQEEALNQVMVGDVPLFNYSGKIAFALWRSVYLAKQASSRNQALIAFDWLRTEAFGRDITRL